MQVLSHSKVPAYLTCKYYLTLKLYSTYYHSNIKTHFDISIIKFKILHVFKIYIHYEEQKHGLQLSGNNGLFLLYH